MISVIVPFWNAEQWLGRCLDSLLIQDDAEFILVDDHSTDGSRDIAYEYCNKDQRFTLLSNRNLRGVSGARNTGLDYASGDYITFLDADDELLPNAVGIYNTLTIENIYQANHLRHYAMLGKTVRKYAEPTGKRSIDNIPTYWCMVWNKLYKREFLNGTRFNEIMCFGEDELFNLECLNRDKHIYCIEADTVTRHFDNSASLSKIKNKGDLFKQAKELMKFIERTNDAELKTFTCKLLAQHWGSTTYLKTISPPLCEK